MRSFWNILHKIGNSLHLPDVPNWLLGIMVLTMVLRIPSFFEPYYYGDEMVYLTLGQGVRQGLTLYKDIHDNKPPLLYLTAAIAGSLFWFKVILAFWSIATIFFFYKLSEQIFEDNNRVQKISTLIFALLTTIPLFEGNIVNSELFMIGPSIVAILILLKKDLKIKGLFLAGFLFGISTLFKVPAIFDIPVIIFFWIITQGLAAWKNILKNTAIIAVGFLTPIAISLIWYFASGALSEYIKAAFLQNIGYLSSFRPSDVQKPFLIRNAPLIVRALIVMSGLISLFLCRKKISRRFILISVWTLFALFAITLSERPYPHYFVQILAPLSFLLAIFFAEKNIEQSLAIIPLTLSFLVPVYYKFYFYPTTSYYFRFIKFATGRIDRQTYFSEFSTKTNRNYQIANFLMTSSSEKDRVFMWDPDSAAVYALSRRLPPIKYVVPYHVLDYSTRGQAAIQIMASPPKFIIITSDNPFPELNNLVRKKYLLIQQIGNANIYSRIDFAPL